MSRPSVSPTWSTDANYPAGTDPWSATPTKVQPSVGYTAEGYVPAEQRPAQYDNFILGNHGDWINYLDASLTEWIFGDGAAGDVVIGVNTSLFADTYYRNLTVSAGFTLNPNGYRIFVSETLTVAATGAIANNGVAGGSGSAGGSFNSIGGGTNGGAGVSASAVGGNAQSLVAGSPPAIRVGGLGGNGGSATNAGGTSGSVTYDWTAVAFGTLKMIPKALAGEVFSAGQLPGGTIVPGSLLIVGGTGGGGGGRGIGTGTSSSGGGGGGVIILAARNIVNEGSIVALGGNGGGFTVGSAPNGGGGGGGGGVIIRIYQSLSGAGGASVAGGVASPGFNTGNAGINGVAGTLLDIPIGTGVASIAVTGHEESAVGAMVSVGAGNGVDYLDVTFGTAFLTTAYTFQFDAYNSANTDEVPLTLVIKTTTGMRIQPAAPFDGEISWRVKA